MQVPTVLAEKPDSDLQLALHRAQTVITKKGKTSWPAVKSTGCGEVDPGSVLAPALALRSPKAPSLAHC